MHGLEMSSQSFVESTVFKKDRSYIRPNFLVSHFNQVTLRFSRSTSVFQTECAGCSSVSCGPCRHPRRPRREEVVRGVSPPGTRRPLIVHSGSGMGDGEIRGNQVSDCVRQTQRIRNLAQNIRENTLKLFYLFL